MEMRPKRSQGVLQRVRSVCVIDHHNGLAGLTAEAVHASRHRMHDLQLVHDAVPWHAE